MIFKWEKKCGGTWMIVEPTFWMLWGSRILTRLLDFYYERNTVVRNLQHYFNDWNQLFQLYHSLLNFFGRYLCHRWVVVFFMFQRTISLEMLLWATYVAYRLVCGAVGRVWSKPPLVGRLLLNVTDDGLIWCPWMRSGCQSCNRFREPDQRWR